MSIFNPFAVSYIGMAWTTVELKARVAHKVYIGKYGENAKANT